MTRLRISALLAVAVLASTAPAVAGPTDSGITSERVAYVKTIPFDGGTAWGARIVGKHLFVGGYRGFSIYDIADVENPQLLSYTPVPSVLTVEDLDTNGEVLVISVQAPVVGNSLWVYDVEDKSAPTKISELPGAGDHTVTCVLDCDWVYGSNPNFNIVDLRDPAAPKIAGVWLGKRFGMGFTHDVNEVSPGLLVAASDPLLYLDARRNPARPKILASGEISAEAGPPTRQKHAGSAQWPRRGKDRFLLFGGESPFSGTCENSAGVSTYDASRWRKTKTFTKIDEFRASNGTYVDGNPPAGAVGCGSLWFSHHPGFHNGGMVAAAFAEHGTRFLKVGPTGRISELGYFVPYGGVTTAAYLVAKDVVYAIDFNRGIDILRFS